LEDLFHILDAYLIVRGVQPNPLALSAHENALTQGALARYNITRVDFKTFTFPAGSKSWSIDNAVLGPLPKRLLFSFIKNADFNGSVDTNPYKFGYYVFSEFSFYVIGKLVPSEGLTLDMGHEKTSVMGYRTLFKGSVIHYLNSGLQIT